MLRRRRHINADPDGSRLRAGLLATASALREVAGILEERVLWPVADRLGPALDALRWQLERVAWAVERRLIWPLRERGASWGPLRRASGAGALAAVAMGALALGAVLVPGERGKREQPSNPAPVAVVADSAAPAPEEPEGPVLKGVAPRFGVAGGSSVRASTDGGTGGLTAEAGGGPGEAGDGGTVAGASSRKRVHAGPAAMRVARRFAEAFVLYEVGERPARAAAVFAETATPRLATALAERPPRQPAAGRAPQARVLNLVPGPRSGRTYTVSASLLRVGALSELRLNVRKVDGSWRVTDVRG